MPEVPRDPRQLARDILAGKISIEELAREQQRRRAAGAAPQQQPQARMPQRIPLPRQVPPAPQNRPQPQLFQRPQPRPQQQPQPLLRRPVPVPPKPQQRARPVAAPPPKAQARGPQIRQPAPTGPNIVVRSAAPVAQSRGASPSETAVTRAKPMAPERALAIRGLLATRAAVRQGIVMAEILGPPVALRDA